MYNRGGGTAVMATVALLPPNVAVSTTGVFAVTERAVATNFEEVDPRVTEMILGTTTALLLLASVTVAPEAGATSLSVTVHETGTPLKTSVEPHETVGI
jgi:hypothetical protein